MGVVVINGGGVVVANGRGNIGDCFPILPSSVASGEDTTPNDIAIQYYNDNDIEFACGKTMLHVHVHATPCGAVPAEVGSLPPCCACWCKLCL